MAPHSPVPTGVDVLRMWYLLFLEQVVHPSTVVQHLLHLQVVEGVRLSQLNVLSRLVAWEARGVEGDEAVAVRPLPHRLIQNAIVPKDHHLLWQN